MAAGPNLGGAARLAYVAVGFLLVGWGFFGVEGGWFRVAGPVAGGFVLVEGLIGYCAICALFGIGGKNR